MNLFVQPSLIGDVLQVRGFAAAALYQHHPRPAGSPRVLLLLPTAWRRLPALLEALKIWEQGGRQLTHT
jgi:hypothetical protein